MQTHLKHQNCPTVIAPGSGPHAYSLVCTRHNKIVQWLNEQQANFLLSTGVQALTTRTTKTTITAIKLRTPSGRNARQTRTS